MEELGPERLDARVDLRRAAERPPEFTHHLPALRAAAVRLTASTQEADELVQESLLAALEGVSRLRHPELLGVWLLEILRRTWYGALRRRSRERRAVGGARPPAAAPVDAPDVEQVRDLLRQLSPDERRIVELKYFEARSSEEIGGILGKSPGTVRSTLFYALQKFEAAWLRRAAAEER